MASQEKNSTDAPPSVRDLYPELTGEEVQEGEENLNRYVALAARIYRRLLVDSEAYARFKRLTASRKDATRDDAPISFQRSNPT